VPKLGALIERFRNHTMSESNMLAFAQKALLLRYPSLETSPIEAATLLSPRRPEDQANNLWLAFNIVQENLIRGGVSDNRYDRAKRLRTVRLLRGIDSKVNINKGLWALAEQATNGLN
jgi:hypothetical protein